MTELSSIVVIGAGLAAGTAVTTLREQGYTGRLTLVGAEDHLPYERPPLSKEYLQGAKSFEDAVVHDQAWYDEQDVRVLLHSRATGLDLGRRTVTIDDDEVLTYDALVLATGAEPRVPPLPGAEQAAYLRTREDSDAIKAKFTEGGRAVLVGGGWIGLEVAAAARAAGMDVTVLEMADHPLGNVLGEQLSTWLVELHQRHGVDVRTGVTVDAIETADGLATGVRLGEEVLDADLVVVATGAAPSTELAEAAGLGVAPREEGGGITVDQHLRTTDPDVYAIGDVALAMHTLLGPLRVEHWDNAIRQGKAVARTLTGDPVAYDWLPYFFTDQFEFSMEYVGHGSPDDTVEVRGSLADDTFIAYWLDADRTVTAAMNVNIWDVGDQLRAIVGTTVDPGTLTDLQ